MIYKFNLSLLTILLIGLISCSKSPESYLYNIPRVSDGTIINLPIGQVDSVRVQVDTWLTSEDFGFDLGRITDLSDIGDDIWLTDAVKGRVYKIEAESKSISRLFTAGRGPREVVNPANIIASSDTSAYVLDTSERALIHFTSSGQELGRKYIDRMIPEFFHSKLSHFKDNTFLFHLNSASDHLIGVVDTTGNIVSEMVPRLIPVGYQPVMHNRATFDYDKELDLLAYAYRGIPAVMLEHDGDLTTLFFEPFVPLDEINADLSLRPMSENVSVNIIIRNVFFHQSNLYVHYNGNLLVYDIDARQLLKKYTFVDEAGEEIGIHHMLISNDILYLMNSFRQNIYKLSVSSL